MRRFVRALILVMATLPGARTVSAQTMPPGNPVAAPNVPPPPPIESRPSTGTESPIPDVLESRREESAGEGERRERRDEIETDRDSFTPAVSVVGRQRLVVESAYSFIVNRRAYETHSFPELLLRYGIADRVELRLGFNYEAGGASAAVAGGEGGEFMEPGRIERETNISYGFKVALTEQSKLMPSSIFIAQGFTPTSGPDPATQYVLTYACGWELQNKCKLDAAMRYSEDSEHGDRFAIWAPSIVFKVPFCERWAGHVEYFSEMSANRAEDFSKQFISPGVHCLLNPNLEVGVRVGWGLNDQTARFFSNAGFGWRY